MKINGFYVDKNHGIHIHCCAACDPLDHFEICAISNLEVIEQTTCCVARCCTIVDQHSESWGWSPHQAFVIVKE
jgi:hypothetical protein